MSNTYPQIGVLPLPKRKFKTSKSFVKPGGEPELQPIAPSDYGVEIGAVATFANLDRRIERGMIVIRRESLPDGTERVTYRNILPCFFPKPV